MKGAHEFSLDGLTVTLPIVWERVDDGCRPPERSGNSMTGNRGSHMEASFGPLTDAMCSRIMNIIMDELARDGALMDLEYSNDTEV